MSTTTRSGARAPELRPRIRRRSKTTAVVVCSLLAIAACAEAEDPAAWALEATDALSADSAGPAGDTLPGGPEGRGSGEQAPFPMLPGEGEPRQYRLRLVNRLEREAIVFASAGAGRVALDTVPGADSTLVDVRLRADHVILEARDPSGRLVGSEELDLDRSAINRWEIARTEASRVAIHPRVRPLVEAEPGDYPRGR